MSSLHDSDLEKIFATFDHDANGRISVHELIRLLGRVGVYVSLEELEGIVDRKSLDLQEFVVFCRSIADQESAEEGDRDMMEAFKVFDQNDDGYISSGELERVLSNLGLWEGKSGDSMRMIYKFDANSDGLLDFQEFKNMMFSHSPLIVHN